MSNKRKTRMGATELQQLQADWDRAAWLERLAIGELDAVDLPTPLQMPEVQYRVADWHRAHTRETR